jgi:glycine/D-amino acid oxidase-like deaminating enzyme
MIPHSMASGQMVPKRIVVVGAGIVGLCVAWHLSKRGAEVTIVDPNPPGSGCSSGNAGALSPGSVAPLAMPGLLRSVPWMLLDPKGALHIPPRYWLRASPWLLEFLRAGRPDRVAAIASSLAQLLAPAIEHHQAIAEELGVGSLLRASGQLYLYRDHARFKADHAVWDLRRQHGLRVQMLDRAGIVAMQPDVAPEYGLGVFLPDQGMCINPLRLATAIAAGLMQRGVRFLQDRAIGFQQQDGRVAGLITTGADVSADVVVVAAGAWSAELLSSLGYRIPLESQRGYHLDLKAADVSLSCPVVPADRKVFITPMETGLRVAGTVEFAGLQAPPNQKRARMLLGDLTAVFPHLKNAEVGEIWMGHRPCLPDSLPVLGPSAAWRGLWFAFGHGHLGLTGAAVTGDVLARAILGEPPNLDLRPFAAERFPTHPA